MLARETDLQGCLNNEIAKNDKLRLRIETIEKEKKDLNKEIDKRDSLIEAERLRSQVLTEELKVKDQSIYSAEIMIKELKSQRTNLTKNLERRVAELAEVRSTLHKSERHVGDLVVQVTKLKDTIAAMRNADGNQTQQIEDIIAEKAEMQK